MGLCYFCDLTRKFQLLIGAPQGRFKSRETFVPYSHCKKVAAALCPHPKKKKGNLRKGKPALNSKIL